MTDAITIPARFNGPPDSGNGGYCCGSVAALLSGPARARLKAPPPLDTPLAVITAAEGVEVRDGDTVVAEAAPAAGPTLAPPVRPSLEEAADAAAGYVGFDDHLFPTCFVCGPARAEGDGLRIFPGPLPGAEAVAAPWTPHDSLADHTGAIPPVHMWAALDCPSYFALARPGLPALLAQMTATVERVPAPGERCVVVAWPLGSDGRKHRAASAVLDADGATLAVAETLWIEMRPETIAAVTAARG